MKRQLVVLTLGIVFGIALTKGQVISWYRIYEMFRFDSFHMYGVIGSAVVMGIAFTTMAKRFKWHALNGDHLHLCHYPLGWKSFLFGGITFGLGWALIGACPAPMFILVGNGYYAAFLAIFGALLGTLVYGMTDRWLPR
jgi:uncharacterized membrane protein YedE/YeeE